MLYNDNKLGRVQPLSTVIGAFILLGVYSVAVLGSLALLIITFFR